MKIPAWTAGVPAMAWPTLPAAAGRLVAFGLHDFLRTMIGHSKGGLVIKNAIRFLTNFEARGGTIVTLGCPDGAICPTIGRHLPTPPTLTCRSRYRWMCSFQSKRVHEAAVSSPARR